MKRLKRFNELFDTGELRDDPGHELSKITGDPSYIIDPSMPMMTFKDDTITNLISKLTVRYPFVGAFLDSTEEEGGTIDFEDFSVGTQYDEESGFYNLLAFSSEQDKLITLGLKVKGLNNYDVYIYSQHGSALKEFSDESLNVNQLGDLIGILYLPELENLGFSELTYYNYEDYLRRNN